MFKLYPLYDTRAILKSWEILCEATEELLKIDISDTSLTQILNDLLAGQILLWVGFLDHKYILSITTRIDQIPDGKKFLTVVHLFVKENKWETVKDETIFVLTEFAQKMGCTHARFFTFRTGWARKLSGWKEGYVEYERSLL